MPAQERYRAVLHRVEGRLWTGPLAHLLGGTLDVLQALATHMLARRRGRHRHRRH